MNPKWKAKWLEALRSGKYRQTRRKLRRGEHTFCCLGVLCDLINPDGWIQTNKILASSRLLQDRVLYIFRNGQQQSCEQSWNHIPMTLASNLGISFLQQSTLTKLNDSKQSFLAIADYIEKNL